MPTFKITIAYDGTDFSGWQAQPNQRTVQEVFEHAWQEITGEQLRVRASSRTDSGVHARGQVVGVKSETSIPADKIRCGLNAKLPDDVVVLSVELANDDFHATHQATGKRYRYRIHNDYRRPVFDRQFVWHMPKPLDIEAMHRTGQALVGKHDFASFESAGSERETSVRTIFDLEVSRGPQQDNHLDPSPEIWIEIEGDGFLYNMVRAIAGSLVAVGLGRKPESWLSETLIAADRRIAGQTAPAQGLILLKVDYPVSHS